jgi:hypothetical protein
MEKNHSETKAQLGGWIVGKYGGRYGLDTSGSGYGPVAGFGEHGSESSDSLKGGGNFWSS